MAQQLPRPRTAFHRLSSPAISTATDASPRRTSLRPLGLEPIDLRRSAVLPQAPSPLVRFRAGDERLGGPAAGSGIAHLLVLLLLLVILPKSEGGHAPEQSSVEMLFPKPGSSGTTGTSAPNAPATPPVAEAPAPLPPPPPETPLSPAEPAAPQPVPPQSAPARPAPTEPAPAAPHAPGRAVPHHAAPRMMRLRTSGAPHPRTSSNPFGAPMDLSFASPDRSTREAAPTRHGSHSDVDLSLGPIAHNGEFRVPYATAGIRGVSPDYDAELQDWIERHLYYPEDAARMGQDGTASVHVVLDRSGAVRRVELTTSAGADSLDDATTGMFRDATLPPVPPDMAGNHFDIDLTVHYILLRRPG